MPLFHKGNAAELGRRGQAARKLAEAQRAAKVAAIPLQAGPQADPDPAESLSRAVSTPCTSASLIAIPDLPLGARGKTKTGRALTS
jgi:hypothetical protein